MDNNLDVSIARIAEADFTRARRKAFLTDVVAAVGRKPHWLMSFEEVQRTLPIQGQHYAGMQEVPVSAIVGSVDRYHDFNRKFLPTQTHTRPRWESVDRAALSDVVLPPVQLYKVGNVYFVKDGNHRVSVAKEKGAQYIDAEVIECPTPVPLSPDTDPRDLLRLGEYARFLEQTKLDRLPECEAEPGVNIQFTSLGRYDVLLEHISAHRWYMGIDQDRPVSWEEAVLDWYDHVYLPVIKVIDEAGIMRNFPGRTPGDLYLWIMDHRWYLREETGEDIGAHTAALSYDARYASWTRKVVRYLHKLKRAVACPLLLPAKTLARAIRGNSAQEQ